MIQFGKSILLKVRENIIVVLEESGCDVCN